MAAQLIQVTASWISFAPGDTVNAEIAVIGGESRLSWGEPVGGVGAPSYLSIRGQMPPRRVLTEGTVFRLCRLRYLNNFVDAGAGSMLTAAAVSLGVQFKETGPSSDVLSLTHTYSLVSGIGTFSCSSFPQTITVGDYTLDLLGFQVPGQSTQSSFTVQKGDIVEVYLIAKLVSIEEAAPTGPAVFAPTRCEVPYIPPIEDLPILDDCDIPEDIQPIVDCPAIDLPAIQSLGVQIVAGLPGPPGDPGPQGPQGPPGEDGCDPLITVSYAVVCVAHPEDVNVQLIYIPITDCWTHIHFVFYVYCPASYGCCYWVWCPCTTDYNYGHDYLSDPDYPPVDNNCPKTDTCTSAPGYWRSIDGACSDDPPCGIGSYYGQVAITCDCVVASSSSSSSVYGTGDGCCSDVVLPSTLYLDSSGSPSGCSSLFNFSNLPLILTTQNCYVGTRSGYIFTFCCVTDDNDGMTWQLTVHGGAMCSIIGRAAIDSCDPFDWNATGKGNNKSYCGCTGSGPFNLHWHIDETP